MTNETARSRRLPRLLITAIACAMPACDGGSSKSEAAAPTRPKDPFELVEQKLEHPPFGEVEITIPRGLVEHLVARKGIAGLDWKDKRDKSGLPSVSITVWDTGSEVLEGLHLGNCATAKDAKLVADRREGSRRTVVCARPKRGASKTETYESHLVSFPQPGAAKKTVLCRASGLTGRREGMDEMLHHICASLRITG